LDLIEAVISVVLTTKAYLSTMFLQKHQPQFDPIILPEHFVYTNLLTLSTKHIGFSSNVSASTR